MRVCVEKVWHGAKRCAFTGRTADDALLRFLLSGASRLPATGEIWDVEGVAHEHPRYGNQIEVTKAEWSQPSGRMVVQFLATHEAFRGIGIGVARASALWTAHGDVLFDILNDGDPAALDGSIPEKSIEPLLKAWQRVVAEGNVIRWLTAYEFPAFLARKVLDAYGGDALARIRRNPFKLLAFASWNQCEAAAEKLCIAKDDPRRMDAVVQHCLYRALDHGHTLMSVAEVEQACQEYFPAHQEDIAAMAIGEAERALSICVGDGMASLLGVRMLEIDAMIRFRALMGEGCQPDLGIDDIGSALERAVAAFQKSEGYPLNREQVQALRMAMTHPLSLLMGGAGVGKTTVLKALVLALKGSAVLVAPTGQAARRMMHATGRPASTIERFIRAGTDIERPYIIVDEASMLDLPLTTRLLRAMPPASRMLLVGDPGQLPPVNFGLIFHKMAKSARIPRSELTIINRQKESTGIPEISRLIREGKVPSLEADERIGVSFLEIPRDQVLLNLIDLKADDPQAQILAPKNAGGLGVNDINALFHTIHRVGRDTLPGWQIAVGDPVIYKKNDAKLDLVNGSLGVVTSVGNDEDGCAFMAANFDGEAKRLGPEQLDNAKLAYGMTVHSAQGSQFEHVIIVVEPTQIMDRTWVYTALTRGVSRVTFMGDKRAFGAAIENPAKAKHRNVLFEI